LFILILSEALDHLILYAPLRLSLRALFLSACGRGESKPFLKAFPTIEEERKRKKQSKLLLVIV